MCNARSLANKLCELQYLMYHLEYNCILVTESWLSDGICNGAIDTHSRYNIFRRDRCMSRGGGVCVLVRREHTVVQVVLDYRYSKLELIVFDILDVSPTIRVFVVYRPPSYDNDARIYADMLIECFNGYVSACRNNIIVGDFNLPRINWNILFCPADYVHTKIFEYVISRGFVQLVDFSTRDTNLLDLIFTDNDNLIVEIQERPPIGHSDHCAIEFTIAAAQNSIVQPLRSASVPHYQWRNGDYDAMACYLNSVDWYALMALNPSAESMWNAFLEVLWSAVASFVPACHVNPTKSESRQRPLKSRKLRKCAAKKHKLWAKLRRSPIDPKLRTNYRTCVHEWRDLLRSYQCKLEESIIDANNVGAFYRFVNRRISNGHAISAVVENDRVLTNSHDKASAFNKHFSSVGTMDDGTVPECRNVNLSSILENIIICESNVLSSINKLKCTLSSGPDNLPPLLFKKLKHCISKPLAMLYTQLLSVSYVPSDWLHATIVPVFKKGAAGNTSNYRPISLTCVLSKILERVLALNIYTHLSANNILHPSQHGFCKRRSTVTNQLECFNDWSMTILSKEQCVVVYIDFSKAFDVVSHAKLIARLNSYGIRGTVLKWIENFLADRTHCTRVDNVLSEIAPLISGVVQGSGIGPLMFLHLHQRTHLHSGGTWC